MDDTAQAEAYAGADFSAAHNHFIHLFKQHFPATVSGTVLDLGCGSADISIRFLQAFPACHLHGVDGAAAMLALGEQAIEQAGFTSRARLLHAYLPRVELPQAHYPVIISNSLLHHLAQPRDLWHCIRRYAQRGTRIMVMDLLRPASRQAAQALVTQYADNEPALLRHDFYHSLLAAYTPREVEAQWQDTGLPLQLETVSDRHMIIHGEME